MDKNIPENSLDKAESKLKIEKITGSPSDDCASVIFSKKITFGVDEIGTLVGFFLIEKGDSAHHHVVGHDLFEIVAKRIEDVGSIKILENLKVAKTEVMDFAKGSGVEATYALGFFFKNAVYFSRLGDKVKIFVYKFPNSSEIKFEDGSGVFSSGQLFVLGSDKFFNTFDTDMFSQSDDIDLENVIDGFATDISAQDDQAEIGALFVQVKGGEVHKKTDEKVVDVAPVVIESELENQVAKPAVVDSGETEEIAVKRSTLGLALVTKPFVFLSRFIKKEVLGLARGEVSAIFRLRRNIVFLAIILILVLGASGYFTITGQINAKKLKEFESHMANATSKYSEGSAIIELNKSRARDILIDADREVKLAISIRPKDAAAMSLASQIAGKLKDTESLSSVEFKTFFEDSQAVGIGKIGNNLVGFFEGKVVEIDKDGKKVDEIDNLGDVSGGAVFDKNIFVLSGNKVFKTTLGSSKKDDVGSSAGILDIGVFLGNVYLLTNNQINKFVPVEGGYSKTADYLEAPEDFSPNSRFAIDGSVWVAKGNQILKYTRGKKDDFSIGGLTNSSSDFYGIYSSGDIDNLYLIDHANSAVLVVGKDGAYKKSYQSPQFAKQTSIMVDEAAGKMYITSGDKILVADL